MPVPAMSKAVPWSTEVRMTGRPIGDVDAGLEAEHLDRAVALVVVHRDDEVVVAAAGEEEERCRPGSGPCTSMPSARAASTPGTIFASSSP